METSNDVMNLINRIEVKTIKKVLDYIDCGIVDKNCNSNNRVYMELIHSFFLKSDQVDPEFQLELLQQTNHLLKKLFTYEKSQLENDYHKLRYLVLKSMQEDSEE